MTGVLWVFEADAFGVPFTIQAILLDLPTQQGGKASFASNLDNPESSSFEHDANCLGHAKFLLIPPWSTSSLRIPQGLRTNTHRLTLLTRTRRMASSVAAAGTRPRIATETCSIRAISLTTFVRCEGRQ